MEQNNTTATDSLIHTILTIDHNAILSSPEGKTAFLAAITSGLIIGLVAALYKIYTVVSDSYKKSLKEESQLQQVIDSLKQLDSKIELLKDSFVTQASFKEFKEEQAMKFSQTISASEFHRFTELFMQQYTSLVSSIVKSSNKAGDSNE